MSSPTDRIEQAQHRLAKIETLHQTLLNMQRELTSYRDALNRKLGLLQNNAQATAPAPRRDSKPILSPARPNSRQIVRPPTPVTPTQPPAAAPPASRPASRPPAPPTMTQIPAPAASRPVAAPAPAPVPSRPAARPPAPPTPTQAPTAAPAGNEEEFAAKRSAPRRKGNPVPVVISNDNATMEPIQGWVLDRSSGGLRILVDQPVTVGTVLSVRPTKSHGNFPWIQIQVRSCQPERNSYALGVQFVSKPGWGEMQAFG